MSEKSKDKIIPKSQGIYAKRASDKMIASEPPKDLDEPVPNEVNQSTVQNIDEKIEETSEKPKETEVDSVQPQNQSTVPQPHEQPQDRILDYALKLLTKAVEKSQNNGYSPISFQFADLDILCKIILMAEDRTRYLNMLTNQVHSRDTSLSQNAISMVGAVDNYVNFTNQVLQSMENLTEAIKQGKQELDNISQAMKTVKDLSMFFLPPENQKNENNKG